MVRLTVYINNLKFKVSVSSKMWETFWNEKTDGNDKFEAYIKNKLKLEMPILHRYSTHWKRECHFNTL